MTASFVPSNSPYTYLNMSPTSLRFGTINDTFRKSRRNQPPNSQPVPTMIQFHPAGSRPHASVNDFGPGSAPVSTPHSSKEIPRQTLCRSRCVSNRIHPVLVLFAHYSLGTLKKKSYSIELIFNIKHGNRVDGLTPPKSHLAPTYTVDQLDGKYTTSTNRLGWSQPGKRERLPSIAGDSVLTKNAIPSHVIGGIISTIFPSPPISGPDFMQHLHPGLSKRRLFVFSVRLGGTLLSIRLYQVSSTTICTQN
jgi:hypothetical protein